MFAIFIFNIPTNRDGYETWVLEILFYACKYLIYIELASRQRTTAVGKLHTN